MRDTVTPTGRPRRATRVIDGVEHYFCTGTNRCGWLPRESFRPIVNPKNLNGLSSRCRDCLTAQEKATAARNRAEKAGRIPRGKRKIERFCEPETAQQRESRWKRRLAAMPWNQNSGRAPTLRETFLPPLKTFTPPRRRSEAA